MQLAKLRFHSRALIKNHPVPRRGQFNTAVRIGLNGMTGLDVTYNQFPYKLHTASRQQLNAN